MLNVINYMNCVSAGYAKAIHSDEADWTVPALAAVSVGFFGMAIGCEFGGVPVSYCVTKLRELSQPFTPEEAPLVHEALKIAEFGQGCLKWVKRSAYFNSLGFAVIATTRLHNHGCPNSTTLTTLPGENPWPFTVKSLAADQMTSPPIGNQSVSNWL
jgi:hypothetical protein